MALTAIDTNVIVRLLTRDDPQQLLAAKRLFAAGEVFVSDSVLLETAWVLGAAYSFSDEQIAAALRGLLGLDNVRVADVARIALAVDWYEHGLDFADALHLASSQHADAFKTFDRDFIGRSIGLGACPVVDAAGAPPASGLL